MRTLLPSMSLPRSSSGTLPTGKTGGSRFLAGSSLFAAMGRAASASRIAHAALRIERCSRQILGAVCACHHVVLDAHATEFLQLLDALPLDHLPDRLRSRLVQQLVDEVATRFDGDYAALIELAREPQERMVVRALDEFALGRSLQAADVVHLET